MALSFKNVKTSVAKFFLGNSEPETGFWSWAMPGEWKGKDLMAQYTRYVYAIVSAIAEEAAKVEFEVMKGDKELKTHPFLELMKKPNPDSSQFQFLEMHFTYMKLMGESFWYLARGEKTKKVKELYLLRPDLMDLVVDKDSPSGAIKGYVLKGANGKKTPFDKEEILHFKMPNPSNPRRGLGTVEAAKTYIETEEYGSNWTKYSLYNSGRPSGVLNIKGIIGNDQFEQIKKQYKEQYSGTQNAGKTMFLKGADGIDYQKLGMELDEVSLKELKDMTRDDIMVMFRVSKTILGISDDVNRANAFEARAVFTRNVIKPELDRFIDNLNAFLMPTWGDAVLGYEDPTMESDEDKLNEWDKGVDRWLTKNDIRKERGLPPVPGGDVFYRSIADVPITQSIAKPADNANNQKSLKDLKKKELREQKTQVFKQIMLDTQDAWEKRYKSLVNEEFDIQKKEILSRNKKGVFTNWEFDVEASTTRLVGNLTPLSITLIQEAAKYAFDMADDQKSKLVIDEKIQKFIHDRIMRLAQDTNDETIKIIEETITQGVKDGDSVTKLRNRINEVYDQATTVRSERIARTETLTASNQGALEAYRESPMVTAKEWSTEGNGCEFCQMMNGKIVGIEENFANLGQSIEATDSNGDKQALKIGYVDIETPPLHPNCRCTILPVAQ